MKQTLDTQSFDLARDNMAYDHQLLDVLSQTNASYYFRCYPWKHPGITQSDKRSIPSSLLSVDHSYRKSGGGVVFHCPGDVVFSAGFYKSDPRFPSVLKDAIQWVTTVIHRALSECQIHMTQSPCKKIQDINFCATYHNPYEWCINNEKIVGIALKKERDILFFQGVIHLQPTERWFGDYETDYGAYFTKGANQPSLTPDQVIHAIQRELDTLFI